MNIFHNIQEWIAFRQSYTGTLGFVPTMGNLHPGHLSLMAQSLADNQATLASIFINPTQFNQPEDFKRYPRTLDADLALLESAGVTHCLLPTAEDMYVDDYRYQMQETQQSIELEGEHRPGHFTGVLTVVLKLLNIAGADRAYFGEKDYQQFMLIHGMAKALFLKTDILACPTVREASGLAYSSRNNRLTPEEKQLAEQFAQTFHQQQVPCATITQQLQALGLDVEYISEWADRRFAAVRIGAVRLIDNYAIAK